MMVAMMVLMVFLMVAGPHHGAPQSHEAMKDAEPAVYIQRDSAPDREQR